MKMMHPQLAERIDPPVLEAWLQAVAFRLGRVESIEMETVIYEPDRTELTADVLFSKGSAKAELVLMNSAIVKFAVKSERLANWFQRPTSLLLYRQQGERFLQALVDHKLDDCRKVLHPKVAEQLTDEFLEEALQTILRTTGPAPALQYQQARLVIQPDERLKQIELNYELQGTQGKISVEMVVRFHANGLQGHLIGFRFLNEL